MAVSKDGLQYRFVIPGTRHASRLSGNPNFGNCRSRTNLDHRAIRGLTCSHVSLRYRHNAASAASREGLYQADIVPQTNSGNLPTAAFDWLAHDLEKQALGPRPDGWEPVFPRDKREAFARRSCSNKRMRS